LLAGERARHYTLQQLMSSLSRNDSFGRREFLTPKGSKAGQGATKVEWDVLIECHRSVK